MRESVISVILDIAPANAIKKKNKLKKILTQKKRKNNIMSCGKKYQSDKIQNSFGCLFGDSHRFSSSALPIDEEEAPNYHSRLGSKILRRLFLCLPTVSFSDYLKKSIERLNRVMSSNTNRSISYRFFLSATTGMILKAGLHRIKHLKLFSFFGYSRKFG